MDSSDETALMHLFTSFSNVTYSSAVQVEKPDNMAFHQGQQCLT